MHTVSQSAESPAWRRRIARQQEIHAAACRLVVERGYDGFMMDDLAGAVGVSRRTLFNHVPDKASAVLGGEEGRVHGAVGEFIARGPSGRLGDDLLQVVVVISSDIEGDDHAAMDCHRLREQAMAADPKVRRLAEDQFVRFFDDVVTALCHREDWPAGDMRARAVGATLMALVRVAMDEVAARRQPTFHEAFVVVADSYRDVHSRP